MLVNAVLFIALGRLASWRESDRKKEKDCFGSSLNYGYFDGGETVAFGWYLRRISALFYI